MDREDQHMHSECSCSAVVVQTDSSLDPVHHGAAGSEAVLVTDSTTVAISAQVDANELATKHVKSDHNDTGSAVDADWSDDGETEAEAKPVEGHVKPLERCPCSHLLVDSAQFSPECSSCSKDEIIPWKTCSSTLQTWGHGSAHDRNCARLKDSQGTHWIRPTRYTCKFVLAFWSF